MYHNSFQIKLFERLLIDVKIVYKVNLNIKI